MDKELSFSTVSPWAQLLLPRIAVGEWLEQHQSYSPAALASDEKFWAGIRKGYKLKPDYINLENGYY